MTPVYFNFNKILYMLIYVDDTLLGEVVQFLGTHFKFKNLGPLRYFLELELHMFAASIGINQHKYVMDIIKYYNLLHVRLSVLPWNNIISCWVTQLLSSFLCHFL